MYKALIIAMATLLVGTAGMVSAKPPASHSHASHRAETGQTAKQDQKCPMPTTGTGQPGSGRAGMPGANGGDKAMDGHHMDSMRGGQHRMDGMGSASCEEMMKNQKGDRANPTRPAPAPSASPKP